MHPKKTHKNLLEQSYYALIIFLLVLSGLLAFLFVRQDLQQEQTRILHTLNTDLRDLTLYHVMESGNLPKELDERVLGFGIYDSQGYKIYGYEDAPNTVNATQNSEAQWDYENEILTFTEQTTILIQKNQDWIDDPLYNEILMLSSEDPYQFLYISTRLPPNLQTKMRRRIILLLVSISSLGTGIIFLRFSYRRYRKVQDELASKEHLIILGTAARTLTHEMKNPLGVIRLQTCLIRRKTESSGDELDIIDEEIDRLALLMDQTRRFMDDPLGSPEPVDLSDYLKGLRHRDSGDMVWHIPQDSLYVEIDKDRLRSVTDNLISNARESGSLPGEISIGLSSGSGYVIVDIRDKGVGIPAEFMKRIREPFFTTKPRGTGLGMFLISRYVDAAGGTTTINSTPGEGSNISVRFPEAAL